MDIQNHLEIVNAHIDMERVRGRANNLAEYKESLMSRQAIAHHLKAIDEILAPARNAAKSLPALPNMEIIAWAQAVLSMPNLTVMEVDTTGLDELDEVVRFTLMDSNADVLADPLIKPGSRRLSAGAGAASGLTQEQIDAEGMDIKDAWSLMRSVLAGCFVVSFGLPWDLGQLRRTAKRYDLPDICIIGADLREHAIEYYGVSYPRLEDLAIRAGYALPSKSSVARCKAQLAILRAMANAVVSAPRPASPPITIDDDDLGDLDEAPF